LGVGLHEFVDDFKPMGPNGAPGLRHLNNGIGESRNHFTLRGPPGELHLDIYISLTEIFFCEVDEFRSDLLALEILDLFDGGIGRDRQDPARRFLADLGIDEIVDHLDVGLVLFRPVPARQPGIQSPVFHIPRHLLSPAYGKCHGGVIDFREITPPVDIDPPTGLFEELDGCGLKTSFGYSEF